MIDKKLLDFIFIAANLKVNKMVSLLLLLVVLVLLLLLYYYYHNFFMKCNISFGLCLRKSAALIAVFFYFRSWSYALEITQCT